MGRIDKSRENHQHDNLQYLVNKTSKVKGALQAHLAGSESSGMIAGHAAVPKVE